MSQVKAIYARGANGVMGVNNKLPWGHVPEDMRRFKRMTSGCIVVMGYNTWLSLGCKPLPNRQNVVVFSPNRRVDESVSTGDVMFATSLDAIVGMYRGDPRTIWVIGGPALIADAMRNYDAEVHRTTLSLEPMGDTDSFSPDAVLTGEYTRVGFEEVCRCPNAGGSLVFERFVKAGIDAGLK